MSKIKGKTTEISAEKFLQVLQSKIHIKEGLGSSDKLGFWLLHEFAELKELPELNGLTKMGPLIISLIKSGHIKKVRMDGSTFYFIKNKRESLEAFETRLKLSKSRYRANLKAEELESERWLAERTRQTILRNYFARLPKIQILEKQRQQISRQEDSLEQEYEKIIAIRVAYVSFLAQANQKLSGLLLNFKYSADSKISTSQIKEYQRQWEELLEVSKNPQLQALDEKIELLRQQITNLAKARKVLDKRIAKIEAGIAGYYGKKLDKLVENNPVMTL